MYADGDLKRDEYLEMSDQVEEEIEKLEAQISKEPAYTCNADLLNTAHIKKALEELVDISAPKIDDKLIERFVEVVTPIENYSYRWKLNFGEKVSRKDRTDLCKIESAPILSFKITFQEAHEYRKANKMPAQFRKVAWNDLNVEVYI